MQAWIKRLEHIIDRSIPYCLIVLVIAIIGELVFHDQLQPYSTYISILDGIIIAIFIVDLIFKFKRSNTVPEFLKRYWIELIALFPAFLFIRVVEEFAIIANLDETIALSQESLEVGERSGSKTLRTHYFSRFVKPLARFPRFLKAFRFYEHPRHHWL